MLNIVFLCSGNGGNLRFLLKAIEDNWLCDAKISAVITDRECGANQIARNNDIFTFQFDFSEQNQVNLVPILKEFEADIIITTVHKILFPVIVNAFADKLINIHYSLLPAFGGLIGAKTIKTALDYGAKFVGTTVHFVDTGVDTGRPLVQTTIPVMSDDTTDSLMDIVFRCGCLSLLNALTIFQLPQLSQQNAVQILNIQNRNILINPPINYHIDYESEKFWNTLKLPITASTQS